MSRTIDKKAAAIVLSFEDVDGEELPILDLQLINAEVGDMASVLNQQVETMVKTMEMIMFGVDTSFDESTEE